MKLTRPHAAAAALIALLFVAAPFSPASRAAEPSPVGRWVTYSHRTNAPNGVIEITQDHGTLNGAVVQMLNRPQSLPPAICHRCSGALQDAPVIGMTILWGLTKSGSTSWDNGSILDPNTGNIYSAKVELQDGGRKLLVRGYLGIALLGRTEVWLRQN